MARPKKHDLERRSVQLDARYTQLEADYVQQQADAASLPRAAFIRKRTLGDRIIVPQMRGIDPAVIVELDRLMIEINAIGNNVNQVARAMNSARPLPSGWENIPSILDQLRDKTEAVLDQMAGSDGS